MHFICYNTGKKKNMNMGVFCFHDLSDAQQNGNEKENKSNTEEEII